jgi:hypothetical protein
MNTHPSNILSNLTDLQAHLANLQQRIATEMDRLSGFQPVVYRNSTMNTSIPLQRTVHRNTKGHHSTHHSAQHRVRRERTNTTTFNLSDLLQPNETVTLQVIVNKGDDGSLEYSTVNTTFDGTTLFVTECADVDTMVGKSSTKPGELLYQFIDALLEKGVLKRKFSVAPWKLCYVVRDGTKKTLDELRSENKSM